MDAIEALAKSEIAIRDGVMYADLWPSAVHTLDVGLMHVRASDGIRIRYDFERDGWVILQSPTGNADDWTEVAFVQSWALCPDEN